MNDFDNYKDFGEENINIQEKIIKKKLIFMKKLSQA